MGIKNFAGDEEEILFRQALRAGGESAGDAALKLIR
jgi:hypothetical protein